MKLVKMIAAGSLAVGFVGSAMAYTDVYVSGSTAFRSAVVTAEETVLGGANNCYLAETDTAGSGNAIGSEAISVVAGSDGTNLIAFHNHFTGSTAGIVDISVGNQLSMIDDSQLPASPGVANEAFGQTAGDLDAPTCTMADCVYTDAQLVLSGSTSAFATTASTAITNAGLTDGGVATGGGPVAIVTFTWAAGLVSGPAVPFTNITQDQASALLTKGAVPLSFFTGNTSDAGNFVLYVGRNEDSGSRVLYQAESWNAGKSTKFIGGTNGIVQWMANQGVGYPTSANGAGYPSISATSSITGLQRWTSPWQLYSETSISFTGTGHSGYNGGGDVANVLKSPNPVTGLTLSSADQSYLSGISSSFNAATSEIYLVTCIGTHDGKGLNWLSYNGVSASESTIEHGVYPLWNYEHLYYTSSLSGTPQTAANELADAIYNTNETGLGGTIGQTGGTAGLPVSSMLATRSVEAGSQLF